MRYIIIGTGNISTTYANALSHTEGSELIGYISRSRKPMEKPTWESLTDVDQAYDAVIVASPNGLHHIHIIEAASLGKHVITEKPLAVSHQAADAAIAACEHAGVKLAVAFQHRTAPDAKSLKALLDSHAFGRIFSVDLSAKFYRPQSYYDSAEYRGGWGIDGGGVFMQQACHNLDILTWFFGLPTKVVSLLATLDHAMEAEDHGAVLMRYKNGAIGTVVASTATKPGYAARLEVHTEMGSFTLTDDQITRWDVNEIPNPTQEQFAYSHQGATSAVVADTTAHQAIILDFEKAIATNTAPLADADSTRQTTQLIEMIYTGNIEKP